ncbi:unnamed protein product [Arabidopsis arenosa]|uniref:Aminotransferase-like plant mobile domain-containing protein n=1 Tax=Arabidopsis arenosa TaxID=38785 RepID=A0A8S2AZ84_ARAAE|nr:unnamed protein product [Arabidopsis arenosa]
MLRTRFEKVPEGCRDCDAYLKAYLLYLLGTVIMPNNTEGVSPIYLPLLGRNTVNKYAWGAAMVGFLKDSLNDTKALLDQRKTGSISGFVYAIMVFALERFACVCEELSLTPPAKKIPLMLAWMDVLSKAPVKGTRIETFRDLLQNMKRDEFKDQLSMIYLRVPCICFNAVAYNRPDKCFRQLRLKKSELQRLSRSRSKHTKVKFSQQKGQDWRAVRPFYRKVNEEWDNRHNYSVRKSEAPQQGRQPPSHASPSHHINDSNEPHVEPNLYVEQPQPQPDDVEQPPQNFPSHESRQEDEEDEEDEEDVEPQPDDVESQSRQERQSREDEEDEEEEDEEDEEDVEDEEDEEDVEDEEDKEDVEDEEDKEDVEDEEDKEDVEDEEALVEKPADNRQYSSARGMQGASCLQGCEFSRLECISQHCGLDQRCDGFRMDQA